jgi:hypothetical protein
MIRSLVLAATLAFWASCVYFHIALIALGIIGVVSACLFFIDTRGPVLAETRTSFVSNTVVNM